MRESRLRAERLVLVRRKRGSRRGIFFMFLFRLFFYGRQKYMPL